MSIKVSIIVPCYGVEKYLDRCMDTLINQTLKDIEIILVDDGSPDRVPEMCDEWAAKDSRVKVIHKQNGGLGFARNSGIEVATGEYIAFVDSDDYVSLNTYEDYYNAITNNDADVVFAGIIKEDRNGNWKKLIETDKISVLEGKASWDYFKGMSSPMPYVKKEREHPMSVWHSIYKTSIIRDNNIRFLSEREIVSEDLPFQLDFGKHCKRIVLLPDAYYYYCLNGTSLSQSYNEKKYHNEKTLRNVLYQRLGMDEEARLRSDRYFIGQTRFHLQGLVNSTILHKIEIVKFIVNDPIWDEIKQSYKPSYLPAYGRIVYSLILWKCSYILYLCMILFVSMRKICGLR